LKGSLSPLVILTFIYVSWLNQINMTDMD